MILIKFTGSKEELLQKRITGSEEIIDSPCNLKNFNKNNDNSKLIATFLSEDLILAQQVINVFKYTDKQKGMMFF